MNKKSCNSSFYSYMNFCEATMHIGLCKKQNIKAVREICRKVNQKEKKGKSILTVSDIYFMSRQQKYLYGVISSTKLIRIKNAFLHMPFKMLYISAISLITQVYPSIGVFVTNAASKRIFQEMKKVRGVNVFPVTTKNVISFSTNSDELNLYMNCRPQVLISCEFAMCATRVYINRKEIFHLPFHNLFCSYASKEIESTFERDICLNVIPQMKKHHMKIMILKNTCSFRGQMQFLHTSDVCVGKVTEEKKRYLGKKYKDIMDANSNTFVRLNNHVLMLSDYENPSVHMTDGERYTVGNNYQEPASMFFFGSCLIRGAYAADEETVPSFLRRMDYSSSYTIHNMGTAWDWMGYMMRIPVYQEEDAVVLYAYNPEIYEHYGIEVVDIAKAYENLGSELKKNIWENELHCNKKVYESIAKYLYDEMRKKNWIGTNNCSQNQRISFRLMTDIEYRGGVKDGNCELCQWIKKYRNDTVHGRIGAVCMNCNPMTNGHLYLIETVAARVDFLYVFILEEDKSVFRFQDRIRLVKEATSHLENISVVPGGKFIISMETMPGYFEKANLQNIILNASNDLTVFAKYIAPNMGISIRFAGSEPCDCFTAQYNYNMSRILPLYGIEFVEISRKEISGEVVSASKVRKLLGENNLDKIRNIVPENVYQFLCSWQTDATKDL